MLQLQDKYQIDSALIELEILETTFIDALDAMIDVINALRVKGFKINVDDFGSDIHHLTRLPIFLLILLNLTEYLRAGH